ncbi:MAG: hypothetical protein KDD69_18030, partial [Bdellovibrionales bacterium]|nr:hypothetical protein [Bdellovibrionales bacterium]
SSASTQTVAFIPDAASTKVDRETGPTSRTAFADASSLPQPQEPQSPPKQHALRRNSSFSDSTTEPSLDSHTQFTSLQRTVSQLARPTPAQQEVPTFSTTESAESRAMQGGQILAAQTIVGRNADMAPLGNAFPAGLEPTSTNAAPATRPSSATEASLTRRTSTVRPELQGAHDESGVSPARRSVAGVAPPVSKIRVLPEAQTSQGRGINDRNASELEAALTQLQRPSTPRDSTLGSRGDLPEPAQLGPQLPLTALAQRRSSDFAPPYPRETGGLGSGQANTPRLRSAPQAPQLPQQNIEIDFSELRPKEPETKVAADGEPDLQGEKLKQLEKERNFLSERNRLSAQLKELLDQIQQQNPVERIWKFVPFTDANSELAQRRQRIIDLRTDLRIPIPLETLRSGEQAEFSKTLGTTMRQNSQRIAEIDKLLNPGSNR